MSKRESAAKKKKSNGYDKYDDIEVENFLQGAWDNLNKHKNQVHYIKEAITLGLI